MRRAFSSPCFTLPFVVRGLIAAGALLGSLGVLAAGCSLGNLAHDDCKDDAQCGALFGLGSTCSEGFCSDPAVCTTGHECRKAAGGGACVMGACQAAFPLDDACKAIVEPPDLLSRPAVGEGAPLVIGGIFSLDESKNAALTVAIRLAVKDINRTGGMKAGQKLGVVFCNNSKPGVVSAEERLQRNNHALDYLAGTLGVPVIIGPLTSAESIQLITRVKEKAYPTVIISPSATSPNLTGADDRLRPEDKHGLFWRTCPSDLLQGKVLAQQIPEMTGNVAVVYIKDAYGEGLATVFRESYNNFKLSLAFPIEAADLDSPMKLAAVAAKVNAYAPGAVVVITTTGVETINVIKELAKLPVGTKPFFFTDGAKDSKFLLNPALPPAVITLIKGARGTAPASPSGKNYATLETNLKEAGLDPASYSFLAQSYDATMIGALGIIAASKVDTKYDGLDVADGLAHLSAGKAIDLNPTDWLNGVGELTKAGQINVEGTSGSLNFDPVTGEAPGKIEIWRASDDFTSFTNVTTVDPP